MFKNILLPYDFENDFSAIPDYLEKVTDEDSVVVIYHVVTKMILQLVSSIIISIKKILLEKKRKNSLHFYVN